MENLVSDAENRLPSYDFQGHPCDYLMRRLRAQFGLEFVYAKLSRRGRMKVMDYARLMLEWERAAPKRVREIDRILARKVPGFLSRMFPSSSDSDFSPLVADEAEEFDEVDDLVATMNGRYL